MGEWRVTPYLHCTCPLSGVGVLRGPPPHHAPPGLAARLRHSPTLCGDIFCPREVNVEWWLSLRFQASYFRSQEGVRFHHCIQYLHFIPESFTLPLGSASSPPQMAPLMATLCICPDHSEAFSGRSLGEGKRPYTNCCPFQCYMILIVFLSVLAIAQAIFKRVKNLINIHGLRSEVRDPISGVPFLKCNSHNY